MPKLTKVEKLESTTAAASTSPAGPSFEEAMSDLQQVVANLDDNSLGLEASLAEFERGVGLLRKCHGFLEQAEQKIEILLSFKANGEVTTAPFDATPTAGREDEKTLF